MSADKELIWFLKKLTNNGCCTPALNVTLQANSSTPIYDYEIVCASNDGWVTRIKALLSIDNTSNPPVSSLFDTNNLPLVWYSVVECNTDIVDREEISICKQNLLWKWQVKSFVNVNDSNDVFWPIFINPNGVVSPDPGDLVNCIDIEPIPFNFVCATIPWTSTTVQTYQHRYTINAFYVSPWVYNTRQIFVDNLTWSWAVFVPITPIWSTGNWVFSWTITLPFINSNLGDTVTSNVLVDIPSQTVTVTQTSPAWPTTVFPLTNWQAWNLSVDLFFNSEKIIPWSWPAQKIELQEIKYSDWTREFRKVSDNSLYILPATATLTAWACTVDVIPTTPTLRTYISSEVIPFTTTWVFSLTLPTWANHAEMEVIDWDIQRSFSGSVLTRPTILSQWMRFSDWTKPETQSVDEINKFQFTGIKTKFMWNPRLVVDYFNVPQIPFNN